MNEKHIGPFPISEIEHMFNTLSSNEIEIALKTYYYMANRNTKIMDKLYCYVCIHILEQKLRFS